MNIPELIQKVFHFCKGIGADLIQASRAFVTHGYEASIRQHLQMLRDGWTRDIKMRGDFTGGEFRVLDEMQNLPAAGFGNGAQDGIHSGLILACAYESVNLHFVVKSCARKRSGSGQSPQPSSFLFRGVTRHNESVI